MATLNVHLLPELVEPAELIGKTAVVIDVLRATTTIVHALGAGALAVVPCLHVETARGLAARATGPVILGGERGGLLIEGFDLGNSPSEYTAAAVAGKTVIFSTTNGTRAMEHCHLAGRVLLAAFANLSAVCEVLEDEPAVEIVCAGTNRHITREDVLLAGAITDRLVRHATWQLNDSALLAGDLWRTTIADATRSGVLAEALKDSYGGRNLAEIGHEQDIVTAATLDTFDLVPELDVKAWAVSSLPLSH